MWQHFSKHESTDINLLKNLHMMKLLFFRTTGSSSSNNIKELLLAL